MLLSILGLLLAGAEPSSYGVLNYRTASPLDGDTSPGYANNVVVHTCANDPNNKTMHNHKVPPACMEHPAAHEHNSPELTSPPHTAQHPPCSSSISARKALGIRRLTGRSI